MQDDGIVAAARLAVVDVIQHLAVENRRFRRHVCRPADFARTFGRPHLREVHQQVGHRLEGVEVGLGVATGLREIAGTFRPPEVKSILAVKQHALMMGEVEHGRMVRFDVAQRADVKIRVGDFAPSGRQLVSQIAFGFQPVIGSLIPHDDQQVVAFGLAVRGAADQRAEKQDVFGIEQSLFRQIIDDCIGFAPIVPRSVAG